MSQSVREKIEKACDDWGSALLITSHNMRDIDHLCSRVVFLKTGKILFNGSPDELRVFANTDDLDAAFINLEASEH